MLQENRNAFYDALAAHHRASENMLRTIHNQIRAGNDLNSPNLTSQQKSALSEIEQIVVDDASVADYLSTDAEVRRIFNAEEIEPADDPVEV